MADQTINGMTAEQVAAVARYKQEMVAKVGRDIELRKLALSTASLLIDRAAIGVTPASFIEFAEAMHKFLTAAVDAGSSG
jgi:hypothetical protein